MTINDNLFITPEDCDSGVLTCVSIGQAIADLRWLPVDQDIREFFLDKLRAALTQYGELGSGEERAEMNQFFEAIQATLVTHSQANPEMHNPIVESGLERRR